MTNGTRSQFRALIVGGGVAGLEAALALRDLAGEEVAVTVLEPRTEFVVRAERVREPFAAAPATRVSMERLAGEAGFTWQRDRFGWLDAEARHVFTDTGEHLVYDAVLLALGARRSRAYAHAITLDDQRLDEQLHGLVQDVEMGYARRVALLVPPRRPWPLPIYEIAFLLSERAYAMGEELAVTIVTPERSPLAVFGEEVSDVVARRLAASGIEVISTQYCGVHAPGRLSVGSREIRVDRILALPELSGPSAPGVPRNASGGFLAVDPLCRLRGLDHVYAAGDGTSFPVKHGAIAAQQADVAARSIAAQAGCDVTPQAFEPTLEATLLTGRHPLHLTARLVGDHGYEGRLSEVPPTANPAVKVSADRLSPLLERLADVSATGSSSTSGSVKCCRLLH